MRLVLRRDAYHATTPDGAYILTPRGPVRLAGRSTARWLDRLVPKLAEGSTLAELTEGLSPRDRDTVERLVLRLTDAGLLTRAGAAEPAELTAGEAREYAPEISYLGWHREGAAAAFARYRALRTLVAGEGPLLAAVARAALTSGLRAVRVAAFDGAPEPEWCARDSGQGLTWAPAAEPADAGAAAALLNHVHLVLHVGDQRPERALLIERAARAARVPLAQVVVHGAEAWLVPLQTWAGDDGAPGHWAAAWPRLEPAAARSAPAEPGPAAGTAVAARLVRDAFRTLTEAVPPGARARLTGVDLKTLTNRTRTFPPHPSALPLPARPRAGFHERIRALRRGMRLTERQLAQRVGDCADERLGVFRYADTAWAQSPLHVSQAVVRERPAVTATGVGFGYETARGQAALTALARYAAGRFDPRLLPEEGTDEPGRRGGPAVPGYELADPTRIRRIPVADAFPGLRPWRPAADPYSAVVGGYDWQEAVTAGLLAHCRRLTVFRLRETARPYPPVALDEVPLDEDGARCRDILAELGELPDVFDITGPLGVPTFAFCQGPVTLACGAGLTAGTALTDGLRQVLLAVQARAHHQAGYAPWPVVPGLPRVLRGEEPRPAAEPAEPAALSVAAVAARLRTIAGTAVAVPLDHDPAIVERVPYLVHVVVV
ncbi:thioesterase domain-containing protein [Streptomyces litchfieldiae]|uniref:YcaO domain-containing protein n=1 Tax=Streptomyces litchfieldiae TaxID=3075543 RepID=A0ABU2MUB9_9ACTN|nr:hypothetical protein [Streptomyces sp. DSM 44938]MDT0344997.1 hypothetical protein [Streptomyces sp. DSM 44938]